eukprot:4117897-Amphidinium_carterae.1
MQAEGAMQMLASLVIPEESFLEALRWAKEMSEKLLLMQVSFLHLCLQLACECAKAEMMACEFCLRDPQAPLSKRRVTEMQKQTLCQLHDKLITYKEQSAQYLPAFDDQAADKYSVGTCLSARAVFASLCSCAEDICQAFTESWTRDVDKISATIGESIPAWQHVKSALLAPENAAVREALVSNPKYTALSQLAQELRGQHALISKATVGLMDASVVKKTGDMVAYAMETVTFTYILWRVTVAWPSNIANVPQAEQAVQQLRKELAKSRFELTDELEQELSAWESGDRLTASKKQRVA